jgi:hypothetical protein
MLVYLASPYSHKDLEVMKDRYYIACKAAAALMSYNLAVFAPIAHSHPISDYMSPEKRTDFEFWMAQDLPILRRCDELWVLTITGWDISRGVTREIEVAKAAQIPIKYIHPWDLSARAIAEEMAAEAFGKETLKSIRKEAQLCG